LTEQLLKPVAAWGRPCLSMKRLRTFGQRLVRMVFSSGDDVARMPTRDQVPVDAVDLRLRSRQAVVCSFCRVESASENPDIPLDMFVFAVANTYLGPPAWSLMERLFGDEERHNAAVIR
jgi:hypothetical protein